jgi:hypothetical protein
MLSKYHYERQHSLGYFVDLIKDNLTYTGPYDMMQYIIEGVSFSDIDVSI